MEVLRGATVEIPLRAMGDPAGVRYKLRTNPRQGNVALVIGEKGAVKAVYKHSGDNSHSSDRFSYAGQNSVGISAPGTVSIKIFDLPAELVVAGELDFASVFVGERAERELLLENRGGGLLQGSIETELPWRIKGDSNYRVDPGQKVRKSLVFAPKSEGDFNSQVRFSSDSSKVTILAGSALWPVVADTRSVLLSGTERRGSFHLTNRSSEPRTVRLIGGDQLQMPSRLEIPPNESKEVEIKAALEQPWGQVTSFSVVIGDYSIDLAVRAPALEASLQVNPSQLIFPKDAQRLSLEAINTGGTAAEVALEVPPPFEIYAADRSFQLNAGERRKVEIGFNAKTPGKYRALVALKGLKAPIEIPVEAELTAPSPINAAPERPQVQTAPASAPPKPARPLLPGVGLVHLASVGSKTATLDWATPDAIQPDYSVEVRLLKIEHGKPVPIWVPIGTVEVIPKETTTQARLRGLKPRTPHTLRVVYKVASGQSSEPSASLQFATRQVFWARISLFQVLCVAAVLLSGFVLYRRWR